MSTEGWLRFTSYIGVLGTTAAVVLVAFLVNRYAPKKRKHVRRTVITLLLYLLSFAASELLPFVGASSATDIAIQINWLLGAIALINVAVLLIFDLGLAALKLDVAPLVLDLVLGGAYIVAAFFALRRWGMNLSGIVTTSAVVTGILALSLQATLGNILGGVALQLDRSIRVGDWIQLENGKQGQVLEIRWRHTVIQTRDWDTLIVPNATLLAAQITILGKRAGLPLQHRMWVRFNVDFRFNPSDVINAIESALSAAPIEGIASNPPPNCICYDFASERRDSFAHYAVRYWLTDLARDDPTSSRVRIRIYAALKRANIPLAVPAAQLFVENDDVARRERKQEREIAKRLRALQTVELLKPLNETELAHIAEQLHYAPFCAGETITRQGAIAHWLYIITEGTAEVRIHVEDTETTVATISAPSFFGEMGLMTGEPRTATVVAVSNVECYQLDKEAFHAILRNRPEMLADISALLAERRIGLESAREHIDIASPESKRTAEQNRLLEKIQLFFALSEEERMSSAGR